MDHSSDTDFITQAIDLAQENSRSGENGPFGALVVKDGKVIGRGGNRVVASCDPSAHAEIVAIREAGRALGSHDLTGCTIYSSCEPCPMCLSAILWARIDRVVYACNRHDAAEAGFDDAVFYQEVARDWQQRSIRSEQIGQEQGKQVFDHWRQLVTKMKY